MRKSNRSRQPGEFTRRQFIRNSTTALAGAALFPSLGFLNAQAAAARATVRTAADQVTLGKTGLRLSRLGFGTGSGNGKVQTADGKAAFIDLFHYAYDHGITWIDTAQAYSTFDWIAGAIKGLPREKLFIQSKVDGRPGNILAVIDQHRKVFNTDYVDSLLIHCMMDGQWTSEWQRIMDGFDQAKEKKWIRAKGVSCHSLPALRAAVASNWTEVHLVRVNPQGRYTDTESGRWDPARHGIAPVMSQIKIMHAEGRGVIGMKICGNGTFTDPSDREKSFRFAMACRDIDAVVIGFKNRAEIDEAIQRTNRALKEA